MIENFFYAKLQRPAGGYLNALAETDLTPQSSNIILHNSQLPLGTADFYSFYGNIEAGIADELSDLFDASTNLAASGRPGHAGAG